MMSDRKPPTCTGIEQAEAADRAVPECRNCDSFHHTGAGKGECRPGPPQAFMVVTDRGPAFVSAWPSVPADGWCSQFRATGSALMS